MKFLMSIIKCVLFLMLLLICSAVAEAEMFLRRTNDNS